ncbi:MAG TPA: tetratricopeptide repeat protein [Oculatellaceae cyanobacterium]
MTTLETNTNYRLGELLVQLGMIAEDELQEMLSIASETSMPVGRVFVLTNVITEDDLSNVILCQSFLREKLLDFEQAKTAMQITREKSVKFDQALLHLGWSPFNSPQETTPLGELLMASNFISRAQLDSALAQQQKSGLPFGRILILSGIMTEPLLASAVNAQILIRDKKITKDEAVAALKESKQRQVSLETSLQAKGFYELPKRSAPRLGELLTFAGIISDGELVSALETGLITQKPVGEVLIESKLLTRAMLDASLAVQKHLANSSLSFNEARMVLDAVKDGKTLDEAINSLHTNEARATKPQAMSLYQFLTTLRCVNDADIAQAFDVAKQNTQVLSQILLIGGNLDEKSLSKADECRSLVNEGKLTLEHAAIAFDYSRRRGMELHEALRELQWQHDGENNQVAAQSTENQQAEDSVQAAEVALAGTASGGNGADAANQEMAAQRAAFELRNMRDVAMQFAQQGNFAGSRQMWDEILRKLPVEEDTRHCECFEGIASAFTMEQDFVNARAAYQKAFDLRSNLHGGESLSVAQAISNLGRIAYFQQAYGEAEEYGREYIRIIANNVGPDHPDVACGYQNLATVYHVQSKYKAAENAYKIAVRICADKLGDSHPTTTRITRNYASLLQKMDRILEAESIDPLASGTISGNWRALELPEDNKLFSE